MVEADEWFLKKGGGGWGEGVAMCKEESEGKKYALNTSWPQGNTTDVASCETTEHDHGSPSHYVNIKENNN